jgi:hypothetical protein
MTQMLALYQLLIPCSDKSMVMPDPEPDPIDCHQNLVHKKVPEMDLNASKAQGPMVLKAKGKD